jgi:glycosyltransferase involved in cell wall biosynthesis
MARVVLLGSHPYALINFRGKLIQDLANLGHEVIACAPDASDEIRAGLEKLGARYEPIQMQRTGMNPLKDLISMVRLWRMFRRLKPDAVFAYTIKPVVYGSLAARLAGVKRIHSMITGLGYTFMGETRKRRLLGRIVKFLYKTALRRNRGVFFQNEDDAELFVSQQLLDPDKVTITGGSGVDLEHFALEPLPEKVRFLMCGRILVEKGVREYFEAARDVKARFPEAEFAYVGPFDHGNPAAISESQLAELNADGQVEVHGFAEDVRPFFRDCSVFVLPSYREGTPRTALEAAAMGRAVITTDGPGGCRQTVKDGESGFLVPVKDSQALAEAMIKIAAEPKKIEAMGKAGRELMIEKFDILKVNALIIETMGLAS